MGQDTFDFERFIQARSVGRQSLAAAMRNLTAEALADGVDATDVPDEAFLEPRLFAWHFGASRDMVNVSQMIYGDLRWQLTSPARVKTDSAGTVILAGIGALLTDLPDAELELICDAGGKELSLASADRTVAFHRVSRLVVPGTEIELVERADSVISAFFRDHVDRSRSLALTDAPAKHLPRITEALQLIEKYAPNLHAALVGSLRSIVLFEHPAVNSLAALGMHGMIFLNLCRPATTAFFVDGLVHQGGHVVFSEATLERQAYFRGHPDTKLETITAQPDARTVYEALHGLYTEYALVDVMDRARSASHLDAHDAVELHGRAHFILQRLDGDLQLLALHADRLFSDEGMKLFSHFRRAHEEAAARRHSAVEFDLDGQPDEFDIEEFLRRNRTATF